MTKISNQVVYIPDTEISNFDYLIGTDFDDAKKTANFRVGDLGNHFNTINGVRSFDYIFYEHTSLSISPNGGYFYSNENEQNPENIEYFIFSKVNLQGKDVLRFFESLVAENPFDIIVSQKGIISNSFYFRITSIETFTNYYKVNVSKIFYPENKNLDYILSHCVYNLKSDAGDIPTKTSDLTNDGSDGTSTYVETDELGVVAFSNDYNDLDNKPTIPTTENLVPYTGAIQDVDLGNNKMNAQSFHVKGTAGQGHLGLKHQSSNATATTNETSLFAGNDGELYYKNDGNAVQQIATRAWVNLQGFITNVITALGYTPANKAGDTFTGNIFATNLSGTNTGDETTLSIQTKRPLKTIEGQSLEGTGNIDLTKTDVGLSNVDNTSDLSKPISTATQTALDGKQSTLVSGTNIKTINGVTLLGSGNITISGGSSETFEQSTWQFSDFINIELIQGLYSGFALASGSKLTPVYSDNTGDFITYHVLRCGTLANGGFRYMDINSPTNASLRSKTGLTFYGIFRLIDESQTRDRIIRIGFHNATNHVAPTDGVYLEILGDTSTFKSRNNNVESISSSVGMGNGSLSVSSAFYRVLIEFLSETSAICKLYDGFNVLVLSHTFTTNIPGNTRRFGNGLIATITTAGTAQNIVAIDYMGSGRQKPNFLNNL